MRSKSWLRLIVFWLLVDTSNGSSKGDGDELQLQGLKPDTFVSAAPLVVAATCADGVVLIAMHSSLIDHEDSDVDKAEGNMEVELANPGDLPFTYRGPLRIHAVDGFGTSLVGTGWRTDGEILATKCRSLAADELERFGEPKARIDYGRYLAQEASFWMAQCAVSDNVRALSCVGLLAVCGKASGPGHLWLIDSTGYYQVRAHAVGVGAKVINKRLRKVDFSDMKNDECVSKLFELLTQDEQDDDKDKKEEKTKDDKESGPGWSFPADSRVEVAFVNSGNRSMVRLRQPFTVSTSS